MFRLILLFTLLSIPGWTQTLSSTNLPIIVIETQGNTIVNEPKVMAHMGIIDNGPGNTNNVTDSYNDYNGKIGIEYRGSSSQFLFDKKGYGIELWTGYEIDTAYSLLGMPVESDWVLHGPYSDKTLMRNALTFHLWSKTGRYGSRTRFVELMLNDEYQGVYVLMEKIKRDKNRVDISKLNEDENSGDDLTGGYIVKLDKLDGSNSGEGWDSSIPPPGRSGGQTVFFQYDYPKAKNITSEQATYIKSVFDDFESRLLSDAYRDPVAGYPAVIDAGSFVDFALINEISRNVDGYRLSTFLYKDKDSKDSKINIGPIWDFNLAFGNANYCEGSSTSGWAWDFNSICNEDIWLIPFWWSRLLEDPSFATLLVDRWKALRAGPYQTEMIHAYIDSLSGSMSNARGRNFQRWPVIGHYVWPNNYVGGTYQQDVDYMKDWISDRMEWLDAHIPRLDLVTAIIEPEQPNIQVYPNPFTNQITIEQAQTIRSINLFDANGRHLRSVTTYSTEPRIQLDVASLPQGVYVLQVKDAVGRTAHFRVVK